MFFCIKVSIEGKIIPVTVGLNDIILALHSQYVECNI